MSFFGDLADILHLNFRKNKERNSLKNLINEINNFCKENYTPGNYIDYLYKYEKVMNQIKEEIAKLVKSRENKNSKIKKELSNILNKQLKNETPKSLDEAKKYFSPDEVHLYKISMFHFSWQNALHYLIKIKGGSRTVWGPKIKEALQKLQEEKINNNINSALEDWEKFKENKRKEKMETKDKKISEEEAKLEKIRSKEKSNEQKLWNKINEEIKEFNKNKNTLNYQKMVREIRKKVNEILNIMDEYRRNDVENKVYYGLHVLCKEFPLTQFDQLDMGYRFLEEIRYYLEVNMYQTASATLLKDVANYGDIVNMKNDELENKNKEFIGEGLAKILRKLLDESLEYSKRRIKKIVYNNEKYTKESILNNTSSGYELYKNTFKYVRNQGMFDMIRSSENKSKQIKREGKSIIWNWSFQNSCHTSSSEEDIKGIKEYMKDVKIKYTVKDNTLNISFIRSSQTFLECDLDISDINVKEI